jgi:hypothetical protein
VALGLQERQKPRHVLGGQGVQTEVLQTPTAVVGHETQEQDQGIAIAVDGVQAHAAKRRQILAEELLHA